MRKEFNATMNFATINKTSLDTFNTFLHATLEEDTVNEKYATLLESANKELADAMEALRALDKERDGLETWEHARDNVSLADAKISVFLESKRKEIAPFRKEARNAAKALVPTALYESYVLSMEIGDTTNYVRAISDWLVSLGFTRRSKDKNGKLWATAVSLVLMASGIKTRNFIENGVKPRSETTWRKDILALILDHGMIKSNAWDLNENGRLVAHKFD